ncbi:MAG TPA: hypothetical protein PKZ84_21575 [Anaerolineae bacterium]|nr:hypothetical protein [Anaerolineae bacterium]HQI87456.1 hypothetical protein [Anaerolineae bacterium]
MTTPSLTQHLSPLRQVLATQLTADDLDTLCFDLGLDYDALPAQEQGHKARELLKRIVQEDRVYELVNAGKSIRPDVTWDAAIAAWSQAQLEADMTWWRAKRDWDDADRRERRERQRVVNVRPLDVTHTFKDRVREALALREHLTDGTVRLVSVVGRGGMGKTALVSHVLADLEEMIAPVAEAVPGERPAGIPPALYSRLRAALQTCGAFDSDAALRAIFVDARLSPWQSQIPEADSVFARIQRTIAFLFAHTADASGYPENALVLLLHVLSEQTEYGDANQRRLLELAEELAVLTKTPTEPLSGAQGGTAVQPVDGILYLSARSTGLSLERIYTDVGRMLGDPVASRLAARWADRDTPLTAKVEYLLETLQEGVYVILLDNLEDVLGDDNAIQEEGLRLFVERCMLQPGGARLITTSREQMAVTPAAVRSTRYIPLREGLPEDDAVALLRDFDGDGRLGLRDAPETDLRRAVQLTQGIPRALEILAGILDRDPTLTLTELLADETVFGEQVMEGLIAAGYERLGEEERRVMEALAVFNRPVDATAIAFLLQPWFPALDVRASLRRLVNSYFVTFNRATGEYSLHPMDREYVYRRIPEEA